MTIQVLTGNFTLFLGSDLGECTDGQVNGVAVEASGAVILDGYNHTLPVVLIGDRDLLTAEGRRRTRVAVTGGVCPIQM